MMWTQTLTQAIKAENFFIFGQVIVDVNGQHYSTEVLMRLRECLSSKYVSRRIFRVCEKK